VRPDWGSLCGFFGRLEAARPALNFATFVAAGSLRDAVVGRQDRSADSREMARMERLADEVLGEGALGVASSLMYVPHRFAPPKS
jgi:N-acyl-D-amino-acid deacylase